MIEEWLLDDVEGTCDLERELFNPVAHQGGRGKMLEMFLRRKGLTIEFIFSVLKIFMYAH